MATALASAASRILRHEFRATIPKTEVVIPRWWSGRYDVIDPARFIVKGGGHLGEADLSPHSSIGQEIRAKYEDTGLVYVTNTGLTDVAHQRDLAKIIMGQETEYEGGANPRGRATDLGNVYDIGAPLDAALAYHHEMTYKSHSIENLGFLCKHAVTSRPGVGWSFVSDSVQAHDHIMQTAFGQKLKDKGLCFVRRMTDAAKYANNGENGIPYNHWQQSWMTDDPAEAQAVAEKQGLMVEWVTDNPAEGLVMQTRYYKSAFEYVSFVDRNIMVTSIADDGEWFDSWPGIKEVPQEKRPLEMFFGDNEPFTLAEKQEWTDAYDTFGIPLAWQPGDVAVLCNMRFAHGRPGMKLRLGEKRELGVMLGPLFERMETREDKW
eukprot:CAMPEP_0119032870 /NCGR_PEP_ID=MMETSP1176-20130426/42270_1 /TAXON_ID=265551 /ORGANISM="Synedropsis recta cf, Strain CCMP1620" /LENGTH=377 /DNA_ID=CAMNT_0006989289 /DNA_START=542 /DNA_END=1675 /DNA_ORIENTATION=+